MKRIWRKVVGYEYYTPTNAPHRNCSLMLKLECGHEIGRKASQGIPKRVACPECKQGRI